MWAITSKLYSVLLPMKETDERGYFLQVFRKILRFIENIQKHRPDIDVFLSNPGRCFGVSCVRLEGCRLLFQLGDEGGQLFGAFLLGLDHVLRGLGQEAGVLELAVELI